MKKINVAAVLLIAVFFYANLCRATGLQSKFNGAGPYALVCDTTPIDKVLEAFSRTAKENPNDTSSADLAMKMLGNLMGGGGISSADSAAAIKSFTTSQGGNGFSYETVTTVISKKMGTNHDTSTTYFTTGGEGRSEMDLPGMMGIKGGNKLVTLSHANQTRYSLTLDAVKKTYSLTLIDTSLMNSRNESYKVTKIGTETINGFSCIHSKLITASGTGMFKSSSTMDVWTSPDVPGYGLLKKVMMMRNVTPKMMQAMDQAGCGGYFVKINIQDKEYSMNMELIKAEGKNMPAAMFRIPAGYKESDENMFMHMMGGRH